MTTILSYAYSEIPLTDINPDPFLDAPLDPVTNFVNDPLAVHDSIEITQTFALDQINKRPIPSDL